MPQGHAPRSPCPEGRACDSLSEVRAVEAAAPAVCELRVREQEPVAGRQRRARVTQQFRGSPQGSTMRIAIDAMGGDQAPGKILEGAVDALALLDGGGAG